MMLEIVIKRRGQQYIYNIQNGRYKMEKKEKKLILLSNFSYLQQTEIIINY